MLSMAACSTLSNYKALYHNPLPAAPENDPAANRISLDLLHTEPVVLSLTPESSLRASAYWGPVQFSVVPATFPGENVLHNISRQADISLNRRQGRVGSHIAPFKLVDESPQNALHILVANPGKTSTPPTKILIGSEMSGPTPLPKQIREIYESSSGTKIPFAPEPTDDGYACISFNLPELAAGHTLLFIAVPEQLQPRYKNGKRIHFDDVTIRTKDIPKVHKKL